MHPCLPLSPPVFQPGAFVPFFAGLVKRQMMRVLLIDRGTFGYIFRRFLKILFNKLNPQVYPWPFILFCESYRKREKSSHICPICLHLLVYSSCFGSVCKIFTLPSPLYPLMTPAPFQTVGRGRGSGHGSEGAKGNISAGNRRFSACGAERTCRGRIRRLTLELKDGTSGINLATVTLRLALPDQTMPDHPAARSAGGESKPLRCVAEVWQAGTDNCVHHRTLLCTSQTDGTYLAELFLMPGDYDLRLWADWNGGYYNADDLSAVTVLTDSYVANGETDKTDKKDAFYAAETLTVTDDMPEKPVTLTRPFARYRLVAADVEAYHNLIKNGEDLPAIEDLQVRVTYEGFFPTGFSVATGKPNDALDADIHYTSVPTVAEGYDEATARQVGADFVLTDGEESAVTVTIQMIDTNTDETVCTVSGIKIPYKRGHLTTVSGHFLTAGGVQVDTEWNDEIINF